MCFSFQFLFCMCMYVFLAYLKKKKTKNLFSWLENTSLLFNIWKIQKHRVTIIYNHLAITSIQALFTSSFQFPLNICFEIFYVFLCPILFENTVYITLTLKEYPRLSHSLCICNALLVMPCL